MIGGRVKINKRRNEQRSRERKKRNICCFKYIERIPAPSLPPVRDCRVRPATLDRPLAARGRPITAHDTARIYCKGLRARVSNGALRPRRSTGSHQKLHERGGEPEGKRRQTANCSLAARSRLLISLLLCHSRYQCSSHLANLSAAWGTCGLSEATSNRDEPVFWRRR